MENLRLNRHATPGACIEPLQEDGWRLEIPAGRAGTYRLAQLDDDTGLPRARFLHIAPFVLELRARVSHPQIPGTWGFGVWNNPFGAGLGLGGVGARLPALPNAAWFFHAAPPNFLALRDDVPANGFLAATFRSPLLPGALLLLAVPAAALLFWPRTARLLRRIAARRVPSDSLGLELDTTGWHTYRLEWREERAIFFVDGAQVFETLVTPRSRLGLVIWIDNQFAAFPPDGKLRAGTLETQQPTWLEVAGLRTGTE